MPKTVRRRWPLLAVAIAAMLAGIAGEVDRPLWAAPGSRAAGATTPTQGVDGTALRLQDALLALRQRPRDAGPHLALGETYFEIGNLPAARHHLEAYLSGDVAGPDSVRAAYLHARTLLQLGLKMRATQALRSLADNPGAPVEAHHDLALLLREDGFLPEAVMAEMRALERGGRDSGRLREAALQWKELRRHDQAAATFATLLAEEDGVTAEDWFQFGYLAHRTKRFDVARYAYETCIALDPGHPEAHYNAAMVAERDGRVDTAAFHLEQVLRLRPEYEPAYYQLGRLFLEHERSVEAASVFRRFLEVSEDSVVIAETRALLDELSARNAASR